MQKNRILIKGPYLLLFFYIAIGAAACSTITIKTDYEPAVDFSRFKTYDWIPGVRTPGNLQEVIGAGRVGPFVEAAVEKELARRGYEKEKRPGEKPDFFVSYRAQAKEITEPNVITYSCGEAICSHGVEMQRYREGTLVLDIIEPESNRVVWRGTAVGVIGDPEKRKEAIEDAVARLLRNFPPR